MLVWLVIPDPPATARTEQNQLIWGSLLLSQHLRPLLWETGLWDCGCLAAEARLWASTWEPAGGGRGVVRGRVGQLGRSRWLLLAQPGVPAGAAVAEPSPAEGAERRHGGHLSVPGHVSGASAVAVVRVTLRTPLSLGDAQGRRSFQRRKRRGRWKRRTSYFRSQL